MGTLNPIRWKSQYYDAESRMYYIGGRYYDPDIKRYVSPGEPEEAMANAGDGVRNQILSVMLDKSGEYGI